MENAINVAINNPRNDSKSVIKVADIKLFVFSKKYSQHKDGVEINILTLLSVDPLYCHNRRMIMIINIDDITFFI